MSNYQIDDLKLLEKTASFIFLEVENSGSSPYEGNVKFMKENIIIFSVTTLRSAELGKLISVKIINFFSTGQHK